MSAPSLLSRFSVFVCLALSLAACGGGDDPDPGEVDGDGDGVTINQGDCNDNDPDIGPDAAEDCNGEDDNCDGVADEGFPDDDNDGAAACAGDCDDGEPAARPGAIEQCDLIDNDCDGDIDEVSDLDGDGFTNCGGDCDDGDSETSPAAAELCDAFDNDCDGQTDEGFDLDDDGFFSCFGDCNDGNPAVKPGAPELCDAADNNCNTQIDEGFDVDGDNFTSCGGDCDDFVAAVNPAAAESCDLRDDDCDGQIDEGFDGDQDGVTGCGGDCDDGDPARRPGLSELAFGIDGKDNDCNGLADEPFADNDADSFTEAQGDCDDAEPFVNPGALEFEGDNVDNDCDGATDEPTQVPCDGVALNSAVPADYGKAIGLCNGELLSAQFIQPTAGNVIGAQARAILTAFGTNTAALNRPVEGARMIALSSGRADALNHDPGSQFDNNNNRLVFTNTPHPDPGGDPGACGNADPANVADYNELKLTIKVPTNAQSFQFRFQFYSSEYPTFRCTEFDDTFLAELTSQAPPFFGVEQNISFDNSNNVVSINTGFFDICFNDNPNINGGPPNFCTTNPNATLNATGFIADNDANNDGIPNAGANSIGAGATTLLTTFSPVQPGETITLRFIIFDEGDDILDSTVLIDGFRWDLNPVAGPVTQQ